MPSMRLNRTPATDVPDLLEVMKRAARKTDIADHLVTLFVEALAARPKLIVELGVRTGESTFVLERVAGLCSARLLSLDVCDCGGVSSYGRWTFLRRDDVAFAPEFSGWCESMGILPRIDVLFIDTSHLYEHTKQEIEAYFPFLADKARVFFHDTNLNYVNFRKNGALCLGSWNNKRGVIRAIEDFFETPLDEKRDFTALKNGWLIKHYAYCNGFTILEKNFI